MPNRISKVEACLDKVKGNYVGEGMILGFILFILGAFIIPALQSIFSPDLFTICVLFWGFMGPMWLGIFLALTYETYKIWKVGS